MPREPDPADASLVDSFMTASCIPMDGTWHVSGGIEQANALLAATPSIAKASVYTASILGDHAEVQRFISEDSEAATRKGGVHGWDPLTYLCFSRFLKVEKDRSPDFVKAATALLDAGADPNTGFFEIEHQPRPVFESAIYGAAGVAHNPDITRLLLERGADPNDEETPYHAPEWFDNRAMMVLVESGKLKPESMVTLLHRKLDWTDFDGVKWLLERGADPNSVSHWHSTALEHSLDRDNELRFIEALLDHGAHPAIGSSERPNAFVRAAVAGRGDALELFQQRGFRSELHEDVEFLAACARRNHGRAVELAASDPRRVERIEAQFPAVLTNFAGAGNTEGVRILLDAGFNLLPAIHTARPGATPLQVAVHRGRADTVKLLLDRGADIEATLGNDHSPLDIAARAMVELSEWTPHESTEILSLLLAAGAGVDSVRKFPTGSDEADDLLRRYGRK